MKIFYIDAIPDTHNCVVTAKSGCTSDKIAYLVVGEPRTPNNESHEPCMVRSNHGLTVVCDEYTLSIYKKDGEYFVDSNCTGELFNTMSAAILANDNFQVKNIESLIESMNVELASYILSVLVYDINMFFRRSKQTI